MISHSNRIIFFIILLFLNIFSLSAQDIAADSVTIVVKPRKNIVSYNYSYAFITPWNQPIAYERALNKQLSFHTMLTIGIPGLTKNYSETQAACFRIVPEFRYYFSKNPNRPLMAGFYGGVFLYYQYQKLTDSEYINYNTNPVTTATDVKWQYTYVGGGISLGYQLHALKSKCLIFDFNTGLQYSHMSYTTNNPHDDGTFGRNFAYSRFLSQNTAANVFENNKYNSIDPRIWLSIGYSF